MDHDVKQNFEEERFEVSLDGEVSTLDYGIKDGKMIFYSTHVYPEHEGKGIASAMTKKALDYAIDNSLKIVPMCSFTRAYVSRHNDKYGEHVVEG